MESTIVKHLQPEFDPVAEWQRKKAQMRGHPDEADVKAAIKNLHYLSGCRKRIGVYITTA